jgi:acetyl esterase/lipase
MTRIAGLCLALSLGLTAGAAQAAPLEAYGKLPSIEQASVSADGSEYAVVVTNGEERRIVVKDLVKKSTPLLATVGATKVRDLRWAGDERLILTTSSTQKPLMLIADRAEWFFASEIDVANKALHPLLGDVENSMNVLQGTPIVRTVAGEPRLLLEGISFVNSHGVLSLFQVDLAHAGTRLAQTGLNDTVQFVVGTDGEALAQVTYDRLRGRWALRADQGGVWREVLARDEPLDPPSVLGLGRRPGTVIVEGRAKDGFTWSEVDLATGRPEVIPSSAGAAPIHDPVSGLLIGMRRLEGDQGRYSFFDPRDARIWKAIAAAYPGDRVELVSWSNDRSRIIVRVDSATEGPAYAIVDLAARKASWIGAEYQDLKPQDIGPVRPLRFKAADGLELSGYLTLPNGRAAKDLPLIVLPHGGPAARDMPGFDWWAQAMASRGYAVLQVNYRGSEGFGWDFQKAGFGEWGRKMQTDLSDGVRYLADQGVIDPRRVCIVGGSYGGYAALAGVTLQHGVYRCAVSFGGVSDLRGLVGYSRRREGQYALRYWTRYMGAEDLGDPALAQYSPLTHAAQASAPILLIHGKDDTVVPLDQSRAMAAALRRAGKPVDLVVQDNADHWLSLGDTRLAMLKATMAFVEKNNPPN